MKKELKNNAGSTSLLILLILIVFLLFINTSIAQNLLNLPESVVYDSLNSRYLVSNWGNGHIVQIDSSGTQSYLITNQQCYAGLHLQGNILYVACREYGVKGFDLSDNSKILDVQILGTTNINDITADTSGYLFVSYPTEGKIYKVKIADQTYSTFVDSGLGTPNGLYFDEQNNRLLIISFQNFSPVQAIELEDSTLTTLTTTNLHGLDGLTRDIEGNFYASSWYTNTIYKFNNTFSNPPEIFSTHSDDPADIYFDKQNNLLAVPLFFTHGIEFVAIPTLIDENTNTIIAENFLLKQNYPNPFNPSTTIEYYIPENSKVDLRIYNLLGQEVKTLINKSQTMGYKSVYWNGLNNLNQSVTAGVYYCRIQVRQESQMRKMVYLK